MSHPDPVRLDLRGDLLQILVAHLPGSLLDGHFSPLSFPSHINSLGEESQLQRMGQICGEFLIFLRLGSPQPVVQVSRAELEVIFSLNGEQTVKLKTAYCVLELFCELFIFHVLACDFFLCQNNG